jgi:hypothetical protein
MGRKEKEEIKKKNKFNFKLEILKPLGISLEILVIQSAITLVLSLLAVMFYNYERIFLISIIPGLIGAYVIGKKYKNRLKISLPPNLRLRIVSIFILLNIIIFYFLLDRYFYEPVYIFLMLIIEIIFGAIVYYISGVKKY